jgi:signal transduction histidine kinase
MPEDHLLPAHRLPSREQERAIILAGLCLLAICLVVLPFRFVSWQRFDALIPVVDTVLFLGDLLTATLLFAQGTVLRSRALLALATGYLFAALIIVPHALTFPGAFSPSGLLGAQVNTTVWLYLFWHVGLPIAVIHYALLKRNVERDRIPAKQVRSAVLACVLASVILAGGLTLIATLGHGHLSSMFTDTMRYETWRAPVAAAIPLLLLIVAIVLVWRRPRSQLDLWLALALWAWLIEFVLALVSASRFSAGWYVGRLAAMMSGVIVLVMLLSETNRLYARLSLAVTAQKREREGRLMTLNAVAASVAHEAKQPLAAIVADAGAGLAFLERDPPDIRELSAILASIEEEGQRAGRAVDSIRAMFANRPTERTTFDTNKLILETAALMSAEFAQAGVSLAVALDDSVPLLHADRRQVQHVLLNLLTNAIEAIRQVEEQPREVIVRSARDADRMLLTVEDSGIGFPQGQLDRLFDTFFTTKPQGTGMGLALCRSIVLTHGGRLWATPNEPRGARFHVQLPLQGSSPGVAAGADPSH